VDLTAVAAFTAAALSLVNVVLSYRLTRRGHREQWRREQERPIVARCLTLSDQASLEWRHVSEAKQDMNESDAWAGSNAQEQWRKGAQLIVDLRFEVAQLDLLASRPVRQAAGELVRAHAMEAARLRDDERLAAPIKEAARRSGQDDSEGRRASQVRIGELQSALVEVTRADLGLGPGFQVPPRSLLAQLLGRYQG
jgi:hypothetical protein